jgi:hypothetical protein
MVDPSDPFTVVMDDRDGEDVLARIAVVDCDNTEPTQAAADAALIAAAPDMLAALIAAAPILRWAAERRADASGPQEAVRLAIAKAEGRANG